MSLWRQFWDDESGSVVSAEAVLLGTVVAAGAATGMQSAGDSINSEFSETAYSIRSLNQSYEFRGQSGCGAWTAGSVFIQRPVEESLAELRAREQEESRVEQRKGEQRKKELEQRKKDEKRKQEEVNPKKKPLKPKEKPETDDDVSREVHFELIDPSRIADL